MAEPKNDPAQMFQQIMQQLTQGQGGYTPDALDFTSEGSAAEGKEFLRFKFETVFTTKIDWSSGDTEGFTSEPPPPEGIQGGWFIPLLANPGRGIPNTAGGDDGCIPTETLSLNFDKVTLVHEGFDLV